MGNAGEDAPKPLRRTVYGRLITSAISNADISICLSESGGDIIKILFVTRGYPTAKYPLNGIFELDQAKALAKKGHQIVYAAVDLRSLRRWRKWGYESLEHNGVKIETINIPCGRLPKIILDLCGVIGLKLLYRRIAKKYGQPDVIHSHFIWSGYVSSKVLVNRGIPLIHTEHYSGMHDVNLDPYYKRLGDTTYTGMDQVIAVSHSLAGSIEKNFGIKPIVVPNILDTDTFQYLTEFETEGKNRFKFISAGNLNPIKRMDLLIKAFAKVFNGDREVRLEIYGDGVERHNLQILIDEKNVKEQVYLMGSVSREILAQKMQESDCFVLASESETFGVVYIEAMAAGLPVIATKCGGPEDFINDTNGILVDTDNIDKLASALVQMRSTSSKYDHKAISKEAHAHFSPSSIAQQLQDIYSDNLQNKITETNK